MPQQQIFPFQGGTFVIILGSINIGAGATVVVPLPSNYTPSGPLTYAVFVSTDDTALHVGECLAFAQTATGFKLTNPDGAAAHNYQYIIIGQ